MYIFYNGHIFNICVRSDIFFYFYIYCFIALDVKFNTIQPLWAVMVFTEIKYLSIFTFQQHRKFKNAR